MGLYVALALSNVAIAAGDPALLDKLVRAPLIGAPALSSDGHYLSGLYFKENNLGLVTVWHIDSGFEKGETLPYSREDINWLSWVGGGRLLLSLAENGLVLYDAHLGRLRPLIDSGGPRPGDLPPFILSPLHDDPTSILMQWEDESEPGFPAVYKVNAVEGTSHKIVGAWRPVVRWWVSPEGDVKLGEGYDKRKQLLYSRRADGGWREISRRDYFKGPAHDVLTVETGGATALVLSAHEGDTRALWRMQTASGEMIAKLAGHKRFDIVSALIDPVTDIAVGASYIEDRRREIIWQTEEEAEQKRIARLLKVESVELVSASRDGRRTLYRHRPLNRPALYFIYDYETDLVTEVPDTPEYKALPERKVKSIDIPVPGLKSPMQAVLSNPVEGPKGKAVVLVHGGPVQRVSTNFSATVGWLVANGYSVLQPNFRGSSGYGERWRRAGYAEWGRDMQKDVRASAEWLHREGIATKGSMCVMGGSYGGYAALMSAIMDDDLFACAVSLNGVTSLPHLVRYLDQKRFNLLTTPRIKGRLSLRTLKRRSPLFRADLVRIPVLMLHANKDQNVPFEHGVLMAEALRRNDKPHEFIVLKGAEHILERAADRRAYLQAAVDFIGAHISASKQSAMRH